MQVRISGQVFVEVAVIGIAVVIKREGLRRGFPAAAFAEGHTEPGYAEGFTGRNAQYLVEIAVEGTRGKVKARGNPLLRWVVL